MCKGGWTKIYKRRDKGPTFPSLPMAPPQTALPPHRILKIFLTTNEKLIQRDGDLLTSADGTIDVERLKIAELYGVRNTIRISYIRIQDGLGLYRLHD